jgi:hypothetical protein
MSRCQRAGRHRFSGQQRGPSGNFQDIGDISDEEWQMTFEVNIDATLFLNRLFRERSRGHSK